MQGGFANFILAVDDIQASCTQPTSRGVESNDKPAEQSWGSWAIIVRRGARHAPPALDAAASRMESRVDESATQPGGLTDDVLRMAAWRTRPLGPRTTERATRRHAPSA